jgi:hypothetical protein
MGTLRDKPGLRRFLRRTPRGLLRVDKSGPTLHLDRCRARGVGTPDRMLGETPNRRVAVAADWLTA